MRAENSGKKVALTLLGGWRLDIDGRPAVEPDYEKGRALLAYLAIEDRWHSREKLAELLWPESSASRANLRQVLSNLRAVLQDNDANVEAPCLLVKRDAIRINPEGPLRHDMAEGFTSAAPSCVSVPSPANCNPCFEQMEHMAGLYRGEFMAGFSLPDCPDFEDWLYMQRETRHRCNLVLLEKLSNCCTQIGDYGKALQFVLRHAELEPWDEETHRRIMRLYALNGQNSAAIAQYETCCRLLKKELGVLPGEETRRLLDRIRNGEFFAGGALAPNQKYIAATAAPAGDAEFAGGALAPIAERRQVTVLYCELSAIGIDDPDDAMELLHIPQARCVEIIRQFSGHIVQAHGGGLLAYFGYPQADEHAARHAVQAAMAVTHMPANGIEIRAAAHTGLVITGGASSMPDMLGWTSKLATRLRLGIAHNEVAISQQTHSIVAGYFDCISLGRQSLPGVAQPVEVFRVMRESGARTRLDAAVRLTPLAGRKAEIAKLLRLWKSAASGKRHVVLVRGEAGIGKSRLLHAMKERLAGQPHAIRELRCFPEFSQSPFHPLIAMLEAIFGFAPDDTHEAKSAKLAQYLEMHYPAAAQAAIPSLTHLLSLPLSKPYQAPTLSPQQQKEQTIATLLDLMRTLAVRQPVLFIVEDLHWIDPSSLELLTRFVEQESGGAILTLLTARPEFAPPWKDSLSPALSRSREREAGARCASFSSISTLALAPLTGDEVAQMLASISAGVPPETIRRIVERADGVPLFVEEMAKISALDNQASIPATLHDLLAARMDKLGEVKYIAQLAATIGREFDLDLLGRISPSDSVALTQALNALHAAGLISQANETTCQFKHALIQQAAYQSQTKADRQAAHQRIAQALPNHFPHVITAQPELLAQHLAAAGESRQAIEYWLKAAQRAPLHSANAETVGYLKAGLQALDGLPAGIEKDRLEFALQVRLGFALQTTQGYGAAAAVQAFYSAIELSRKIGNTPGMFNALLGLADGISSHPDFDHTTGLELAHQLLGMAQESGDPLRLQQAHYALGSALFWMGDFVASHFHHEQAIALDPSNPQDMQADDSGRISSVASQAFLSCILWLQGLPEQALATSRLSIKRARHFDHPNTLAFSLTFAAALQRWSGNEDAALSCAEEGLLLAQKMDFPVWQITNAMQQGWVLSMQGKAEGVAQIRQCVDSMRIAMGGVIIFFSAALADVLLHHGQAEESLAVLNDALDEGEKKNDHHFEAELHRLRGECMIALSRRDEAELCFRRAQEVSNRQGAKSMELRAAISLARLSPQQGKRKYARQILEDIYNGFTEGFDTRDLQSAHQLLRATA